MEALSVQAARFRFGAVWAVDGASLAVEAGERRAVIGPNGAGKTTLFHVISGRLHLTQGRIRLFDHDVTALPEHRIARLGLARTFQRNNVFPDLPARANVRLAVQATHGVSHRAWSADSRYQALDREAADVLAQVGLGDQAERPARLLSHGEQRQLELAIALATRPRLLLLDEPTAGLSKAETLRITALIAALPASTTIMIIEHDMDVVFRLATRITVMHQGQVLVEGAPEAVRRDPRVREVYLGSADSRAGTAGRRA